MRGVGVGCCSFQPFRVFCSSKPDYNTNISSKYRQILNKLKAEGAPEGIDEPPFPPCFTDSSFLSLLHTLARSRSHSRDGDQGSAAPTFRGGGGGGREKNSTRFLDIVMTSSTNLRRMPSADTNTSGFENSPCSDLLTQKKQ